MAEKVISKRAFFPKGEQLRFLNDVQDKLSVSNKELSKLIGKNIRTLNDWKREKFLMSHDTAKFLSKKSSVKIHPKVKIKEAYWYTSTGSSAGGLAVYKKYGHVGGNQEERKRKWHVWWNTKGKFQKHPILNRTKPIRKPSLSNTLAEFVGILLGDGCISKRQMVVTLHRYDDSAYSKYVQGLIKGLFHIVPGIYRDKKALADDIVVSRTELIRFCVNNLGLKVGNKVRQQVDVPSWIKKKKSYSIACLRGLMDTDGCIIKHFYTVGGKEYCYKKISFTNSSIPLVRFVLKALKRLGMTPRIARNKKEARLDSQADMKKYFHIVGSSNPKHLNRWLS